MLLCRFRYPFSEPQPKVLSRICRPGTEMASASVPTALPLSSVTHNKPSSKAFFRPLPLRQPKRTLFTNSKSKLQINASLKEKALTGLTGASFTASMVIPEVAHAAGYDFSPSLKNFLLSIFAGGVVLGAIFGAVIGVSNFDPDCLKT
ncbi:hypothetical protein CR513_55581, partial [Mucuna pruriens]